MTEDETREREFMDNEADRFGWDGEHVEDAVRFARMFRRQRDESRSALASAEARVEALTEERELADLAADSLATCKRRGWSTHWTERGAYLHLEASELIEAIRGKGTSTPAREAGDVLLVLMSLTQAYGVPWPEVVAAARAKVEEFRTKPRYAGEEFNPNVVLGEEATDHA